MSDANNNLLDKTRNKGLSSKKFLKYAGTSAATFFAFGLVACSDDNPMDMDENENEMVNLGSGNVGVLNYAYAPEQLEAAFYIAVSPHHRLVESSSFFLLRTLFHSDDNKVLFTFLLR